jgi:hypothetical protein
MNLTQMAQLAHGFNFLHRLEHVIDARRESHGSYEAALASMGADLDQARQFYADHGKTPEHGTLELLLFAFSDERQKGGAA